MLVYKGYSMQNTNRKKYVRNTGSIYSFYDNDLSFTLHTQKNL